MKLRGKLILSCTALAAVATTAFSTTYAWYTANSTVTATGIQASTASAASDALQISLDGNAWGATVDLTNTLKAAKSLTPVQRTYVANSVGTYNVWSGDTNAVGSAAVAGTNIVQFDLYFRNVGAAGNITITAASITNAQNAALPTQKTLADIGTAAANYKANQNPTYTVDLLRALDMEIVTKTTTVGTADAAITVSNLTAAEGFDKVTTAGVLAYRLADNPTSTDTLDDSKATGYNAHTYYNQVKGIGYILPVAQPTADTFANGTYFTKADLGDYRAATSFTAGTTYYINAGTGIDETKNGDYYVGTTAADATTGIMTQTVTNAAAFDVATTTTNAGLLPLFQPGDTNIKIANTTETTIVKATFTIFLNGWDIACFDAVKGQNISMDLTFSSVSA